MEEMIELNLRDLDEWNKSVGLQLTRTGSKICAMEFLDNVKEMEGYFRHCNSF